MKRNKKAFTLIELVSVLVILAILTLIVTPLVLNIIRKTRTAADKRSIDAYGRSIELAIADYLLENGTFPTSIDQLTVEYSGDTVTCTTTQLNTDSSVYLAGCTVGNRTVEEYTYGKEETVKYDYVIGNIVEYNEEQYYVIENSVETESTVKLLKAEPLTVEEANEYGSGHINMYTDSSQGTVYDINGYGGIAYYSSATCGYNGHTNIFDGCLTDYSKSEVKYVVDNWSTSKISNGLIESRLITMDELLNDLGFEYFEENTFSGYRKTEDTPTFIFNSNYGYWTMSSLEDNFKSVYAVATNGNSGLTSVSSNYNNFRTIRPVVIISKSVLN